MSYLFDCSSRFIAHGLGIIEYFQNPKRKILQGSAVGMSIFLFLPFSAHALGMGEVQSESAWEYVGWACDSSAPGYQSVVQAKRDDGVLLGRVVADRTATTAIPRECASPHEFHGFKLYIERKPEWVDGKVHEVAIYSIDQKKDPTKLKSFMREFSGVAADVKSPKNMGDIVGRDLNISNLGAVGHLGIWDGSRVVEVLNEDKGLNKVFRNTWDDFTRRTTPWNTVGPKYSGHMVKSCWSNICDINHNRVNSVLVSAQQAVVYRALQIYQIGADYSYTLAFTTAEPFMHDAKEPAWRREAIRGKYRSDVFIYDAFRASTDIAHSGIFPYREVYGMPHSWRDKVSTLYGMALTLPYKVFEKIRDF